MKAFVHDRIDELDETAPFGASFHHGGPYEAIATNLARPEPIHPSRPPTSHHSASRRPSLHAQTGLSLHLEPGQILQPNTIYSSHLSSVTAVPQPITVSTRPDPSRRQSLPNPRTRHHIHKDTSPSHNRQPPSLRAPRERYLGDYAPLIPNGPPPHHDHDPPTYVHRHSQTTVLAPPRYESRLLSGPPRSPQHTPPPTSPQTHSSENVPPPQRHHSRHKTHSLHSSHSQSSSSVHNDLLEPPRIRHLPKRLVMPAPLQPQPPRSQYEFPLVEPPPWQDEYPDDQALEGAHLQGKPAMYGQEPRPPRKKSSAFPAKTPIPDHAPISQGDAAPIRENSSAKSVNGVEETKERARRRRLSKRKSAI